MVRRIVIIWCVLSAVCIAAFARSGVVSAAPIEAGQAEKGWQLPPDAEEKKSPLQVDAKVLATGRAVFKDKCVKCHGRAGLGDGPDAEPEHREHMDLTNPKRADRNADGIVFYKVWNGRKGPKMPAFKEEITEQQAWSVVAYVQTLRKK